MIYRIPPPGSDDDPGQLRQAITSVLTHSLGLFRDIVDAKTAVTDRLWKRANDCRPRFPNRNRWHCSGPTRSRDRPKTRY
jgi:hypothetical protein